MIGPTKYWIQYLDSQNISYESDEVSFDINVKPNIYDYLINWTDYYKNISNFNLIKNQTLPDVINLIHTKFLGNTIDITKLAERDDVVIMKNQINELTERIEKEKESLLIQKLKKMQIDIIEIQNEQKNFSKLEEQITSKLKTIFNEETNKVIKRIEENNEILIESYNNNLNIKNDELNKSNGQLRWARSEIDKIRCSKSYKIGLAITWLPRKIISFF